MCFFSIFIIAGCKYIKKNIYKVRIGLSTNLLVLFLLPYRTAHSRANMKSNSNWKFVFIFLFSNSIIIFIIMNSHIKLTKKAYLCRSLNHWRWKLLWNLIYNFMLRTFFLHSIYDDVWTWFYLRRCNIIIFHNT